MRKPITPDESETRITDAYTGGQKGTKLPRYDLIPVAPLEEVAKLYGSGALKYEDRNWERGYSWSLSYSALMRHLQAFWDGDDFDMGTDEDPGTGRHHLAAVVFHAFALMEMQHRETGTDDRPVSTSEIDIRKYGAEEVASWYEVPAEMISDTLVMDLVQEWYGDGAEEVPHESEHEGEPIPEGARVMTLGAWEYEVIPGTIGEVVAVAERSTGDSDFVYEVEVPTLATRWGDEEQEGPTVVLLAYSQEIIPV